MGKSVHLDVDPGNDDAVMLALALAHADITVEGISTVAGNTGVDNTTRNAMGVLELLGRTDVSVARGCDRPIVGELESAEDIHGVDGIAGSLPSTSMQTIDAHGVEYILEQVDRHGDELTLVAVGPLTNVATALAIDPDIPAKIEDLYLMGGAALTAGNVTPAAEYNFFYDPTAARKVLAEAHPTIVGLNVTDRATLQQEQLETLARGPEPLRTISGWLAYTPPDELLASGPRFPEPAIHDATVIAGLIEDVLTTKEQYVNVDTTGGPSHGAMICDVKGVAAEPPNAEVAMDIDVNRFRDLLLGAIGSLDQT